jgi:outer membrane receptor for ferrienterochelin and colicins
VMAALSMRPVGNRWYFDVNAHYYGRQQLPSTEQNPVEYQRSSSSKPYALFNVQITRIWKGFEFYLGGENLFDFRQLRPINSWQQPFSPYFDTSLVWGPTRGRELYVGIRYKIQ